MNIEVVRALDHVAMEVFYGIIFSFLIAHGVCGGLDNLIGMN